MMKKDARRKKENRLTAIYMMKADSIKVNGQLAQDSIRDADLAKAIRDNYSDGDKPWVTV